MKVMNIVHDSIVDGAGFRTVVFFAGCPHHCKGCHNPQSWNEENGTVMTKDEVLAEIIGNELTNVTLSGGEPFSQSKEVASLAQSIQALGKTIWCYTGYEFEQLLEIPEYLHLLTKIDVLVDGKFNIEERDLSLLYKGSRNQRIIDVKRSLQTGNVLLYKN